MYLSFYHLKQKPFQISTDPRFLWLGEKHEEALATLKYGILDNKGFLLLTGDVGTGKTTLINTLKKTLGDNILVASIRDPALDPMDFFKYTAHSFGLEMNFSSKGSFLIQFERFLFDAKRKNKKVLLIIDEAQRINQELLEEVRLLSNIEREDTKLLNIFFVGQIEFNEILLRPENRPIRQRITVNYNIQPLTHKETGEYVLHRLKIAGRKALLFEKETLTEIFSFSNGYPRLINIICDRSLLTGFVEESKTITPKHVKECANELEIPVFPQKKIIFQEQDKNFSKNDKTPHQEYDASLLHALREEKSASKNSLNRGVMWILFILLTMPLLFYIFSENGIYADEGRQFVEMAKNILGPTNKMPTDEKTTHESPMVPQPETSLDINKNPPSTKGVATKQPLPDDIVKSLETTNSSIINGTDFPHNTELQEDTSKNIKKSGITLDSEDSGIATIDASKTINDNPLLKDNLHKERKEITFQSKRNTTTDTFEKLIIPFPSNSNLPPATSLDKLNILVESMQRRPTYKIKITGFTDTQGSEKFNMKLSEFRANTIKSYLMGRGLEESRMTIKGLGSQNPISSNDTFAGRMENRRVEIEFDL